MKPLYYTEVLISCFWSVTYLEEKAPRYDPTQTSHHPKFESGFLWNLRVVFSEIRTIFSLIVLRMRSKLVIADSRFVPGILEQLYLCYRKIRLIPFRFERSCFLFSFWQLESLRIVCLFYILYKACSGCKFFINIKIEKAIFKTFFTFSVHMSLFIT